MYIELQAISNFSFLQGASHPHELVQQAKALGYAAIGIADRNTLAGVVRAHVAAKECGIRLIVGCRLDFADDTPSMLCYPHNRDAYAKLSHLLTIGKRRAPKGQCWLYANDLDDLAHDRTLIILGSGPHPRSLSTKWRGKENIFVAISNNLDGEQLFHADLPPIATNDVQMHVPERKPLHDILSCIREHDSVQEAGLRLHQNAERYLKSPQEMVRLFRHYPEAIANTLKIAEQCRFSLDELRYEYPETGGDLEAITWEGAHARYPNGVPEKVTQVLKHELKLISELRYEPYFLTVYELVKFAQSRGILYQGRGSAANSAVCYCIGITAVDPSKMDLLFERFISKERSEPPDIDVDFEHERREEVIQFIYERYGRERAGIAATVITYRKKSAVRDVGKALGFSIDEIEAFLKSIKGVSLDEVERNDLLVKYAREILSFPRHLGQHVGGFVITRGPLHEMVPIGNAAMPDRTFIEWDKDDLEAMCMMKVDVLALGMLSCIRRCFELLALHREQHLTLVTLPAEDSRVYDMLCKADTIGVFQVESRAQMSMLPRLKPRCYYDLVIEVALVRPGPIQGNMVHPYLRRRNGEEAVSFPSQALQDVLGKTLGVPLFQEQAMRIAVVGAGFTPGEADSLRRAMATFKKTGLVHQFRDKFIGGMIRNGYESEFATSCFEQILGFGEYGFPESHAASFALLVYVSAWFKCHHPGIFACALLNSMPMGFYAPAQIIYDAQHHGVTVLPVDVNHSQWDNFLESPNSLRLGFRQISGVQRSEIDWLIACRLKRYQSVEDVVRRSGISRRTMTCLSKANAFGSLQIGRQMATWQLTGLDRAPLPLLKDIVMPAEAGIELPELSELCEVLRDYEHTGFSLGKHPVAFWRNALSKRNYVTHVQLKTLPNGRIVKVAGLVIMRQRPPTAKGVAFVTLEDEYGFINVIIWPDMMEANRHVVLNATTLAVEGKLQRQDGVIHVIAQRLTSDKLSILSQNSDRQFLT